MEGTIDEDNETVDMEFALVILSIGSAELGKTTLLSNSSALTGVNLIFGGEMGEIMSKSYWLTSMSMLPNDPTGATGSGEDRVAFLIDWSISPSSLIILE